jgi:hypothetical protein
MNGVIDPKTCEGSVSDDVAATLSRRRFLGQSVALAALVGLGELPERARAAGGHSLAPRNIRVSRDRFAYHAEPFVAVNPRDPKNLLAVCTAVPPVGRSVLATYSSFDGGATWRSNGELPESDTGRNASVAFDSGGVGFVCGNTRGVSVWKTSDRGRTFSKPVVVTQGQADYPWLAIGPAAGRSRDILSVVWSTDENTKLGFARSTDGGSSFDPVRTVAEAGGLVTASPMLAAGSDGLVCAIFGVFPTKILTGGRKERRPEIIAPIRVACSTDYGLTFAAPIELGLGAMEMWVRGGASGLSLPMIAADRRGDVLYAAFTTRRPRAMYSRVVVTASRDRGRTWSRPLPVTPARRGVFYFSPYLAVDAAGGVGISAFALERGRVTVVFVSSPRRPFRFSALRRVSAPPFDPAQGSLDGGTKHGAWWIGDHQGLVSSAPGKFHPIWNDTRTGRLELFTAEVRAT